MNFQEMLYQTLQGPRVVDAAVGETVGAIQIGKGVRVAGITRIHEQGAGQITERPFDLAIDGDGYLRWTCPDGEIGAEVVVQ